VPVSLPPPRATASVTFAEAQVSSTTACDSFRDPCRSAGRFHHRGCDGFRILCRSSGYIVHRGCDSFRVLRRSDEHFHYRGCDGFHGPCRSAGRFHHRVRRLSRPLPKRRSLPPPRATAFTALAEAQVASTTAGATASTTFAEAQVLSTTAGAVPQHHQRRSAGSTERETLSTTLTVRRRRG
jgi:hypothetical protein